jgi:hypothetical protein
MSSTTSSSNLTSGFIDLATFDEPEKYMYGGKDAVSYFVRRVRKSTWFTTVPVTLTTTSNPSFGAIFEANVSRAGDYMLYNWFRVTTPQLVLNQTSNQFVSNGVNNGRLRWTRNLMHNLIKEISFNFNDLVAMRFDNYYLDFWTAFTTPQGKRNGYDNMIGNIDELINPLALGGGNAGLVIDSNVLNLPLPSCWSRDTGVSLPTAALPYNDMRIRFNLQPFQNLIVLDNIATGVSTSVQAGDLVGTPTFVTADVWAEYAIVSGDERKRMGKKPRDILIEQVQTNPLQPVVITNNSQRFDVHLSHSIKALFFGYYNTTNPADNSNYTAGSAVPQLNGVNFNPVLASDPIITTSLYYENTQRLSNMGSDYFSLVQPWYKAVSIPKDTGYHMYSYTLDLVNCNPMGSTNYGKLTNVTFQFAPSTAAQTAGASVGTVAAPNANNVSIGAGVTQTFGFILVVVNHNIVRISGGALGFPVL